MAGERKRYSAGFKAKVALEAIRGEATIAELVSKHGVHQTLINAWKRQAIEGMAGVFSGKAEAAAAARDGRAGEAARQDRAAGGGTRFFSESLRTMSVARRREMIEPQHPSLPVSRQCALVGISRSAWYGPRAGESALNLALMRLIDAQFLETPWYGSRQMTRHLRRQGHVVGRKRVRRLMAKMGLAAVYQRPRTTVPHPEHRTWPYLLRKCVYLHAFETGSEARAGIGKWVTYYNTERPHSALGGRTPLEAHVGDQGMGLAA